MAIAEQLYIFYKFFYFHFHHCRYPDGTVKLRNPNIELMDQDILYHLALGSGSHDLHEMFGDVKVIQLVSRVLRGTVINFPIQPTHYLR